MTAQGRRASPPPLLASQKLRGLTTGEAEIRATNKITYHTHKGFISTISSQQTRPILRGHLPLSTDNIYTDNYNNYKIGQEVSDGTSKCYLPAV